MGGTTYSPQGEKPVERKFQKNKNFFENNSQIVLWIKIFIIHLYQQTTIKQQRHDT